MPKKTLFRSFLNYENGKSSSTANKESTETPSIPSPSLGTAAASWTEAALEKANMAVLYDFTGSPKQALDAYNEAIGLLDKVFEASIQDGTDQSRLKKIYDSYMDRVSILTHQINNNELDATPAISIPIAESPSHKPLQPDKQSPPLSMALHDSLSNLDSKAQPPPPPPIPNQSSKAQQPSLPPLPKATKSHKATPAPPKSPSGSLFGSIFLRKNASKEHMKSSSGTPSATANHSIFYAPSPSKSTPTLSTSRSTKSWKKQSSSKKKQRHSTEVDSLDTLPFTFSSSKLDLPSLTLPDVDIPKDDDYFDLRSTAETNHLLYSTSSEQQQPFTSLVDLHRIDDNNNESDKYGNDNGNHMVHKGYSSHVSTDNSNNDSQQPVAPRQSTTMTRSPSSSSSFSGNTSTKHQPYTSSARNSSIYSPTRSSIYSTSTWADDYSIVSNKLPPPPSLLFLPEINAANHSTSSFFTDSTDFAIDDLTKFLADSAATMPDRSHHHQRPNAAPSIAAVAEEEPHELSSSIASTTQIDEKQQQQQSQSKLLARSPSSKSAASSSSSSHSINTATHEQPAPLPSNSSKSISFWNKRGNSKTTTKPKTFKTLAPLRTDHQHSKSIDDTKHQGSDSLPTTPRSVATSIGQSFLSPTTPSKRPTTSNSSSTMPHHFFGVSTATAMSNKGINVQRVFESTPNNKDNKQPKLMARLLQSMEEGGYITDRIHAPKQLWYQTQVRLPAIDAKIASCELLLVSLQRMHTRTRHLDVMTTDALHDLGRLEHTLDQIKHTFGKSAAPSHDPLPPLTPTPHASHSSSLLQASSSAYQPSSSASLALTAQEQQQQHSMHSNNNKTKDSVATWSSKWSKSVERIRMDTKSSEEQVHAYISTLIRLFSMASVLDEWRDTLMDMTRATTMDKAYLYDHLLQKTMMCTGTLHTSVCSFVVQDFAILMNKWLKRHRDWLLDD